MPYILFPSLHPVEGEQIPFLSISFQLSLGLRENELRTFCSSCFFHLREANIADWPDKGKPTQRHQRRHPRQCRESPNSYTEYSTNPTETSLPFSLEKTMPQSWLSLP